MQERNKIKQIPFYKDKRRLAWVIWGLISNNKVNQPLNFIFTIIDYCWQIMFITIIALNNEEKDHMVNGLENKKLEEDIQPNGLLHSMVEGKILSGYNQLASNERFLEVSTIILASLNAFVLLAIFFYVYTSDTPGQSAQQSFVKQALSFIIQLQTKTLLIFEVWVVVMGFSLNIDSPTIKNVLICLNSTMVVMLLIRDLFIVRLFNITIKNKEIPWSQKNNFHAYVYYVQRIVVVIVQVFKDNTKTQIVLTLIVTLISQVSGLYLNLTFEKYLLRLKLYMGQFILYLNLVFFLEMYLGTADFVLEQGIVFSLFGVATVELFIRYRNNDLKTKLLTGDLKSDSEIEQAFTLYMLSLEDKSLNQTVERDLQALYWTHKKTCLKFQQYCYCRKLELRLEQKKQEIKNKIQKKKNRMTYSMEQLYQNQDTIKVRTNLEGSSSRLKEDNSDEDISGSQFVQDIRETFPQKENKQRQEENINTLFNVGLSAIKQKIETQNDQDDDCELLFAEEVCPIQNIDEIAAERSLIGQEYEIEMYRVLLLIIYDIIKEFDRKFDYKNQRIITMRAYFELVHMKNKFLCHSSLTRLSQLQLGVLNLCIVLIDSQYLLEKANKDISNKDSQNIDMQEIIQNNILFQQFYELNEETASSIAMFWNRLYGENIDIEALYKEGIVVSNLITQIIKTFQKIQVTNKRNYSIFYHYACFHKCILNNDTMCDLYLTKMHQIQEINKAIKNTYRKEMIKTDVDESGFLIVRGTFKEFGEIIFANRTMSSLIGYERSQIVSKQINILMPQIISDSHHKFWNQFNQNGVPSFIERNQHLFMKRQDGYIMPFLVYVKFHYDKQYGHVFIAIVNKVKDIFPFSNMRRYHSDELMIIMTDDKDHIVEVSRSVKEIIGMDSAFVQQNSQYIYDGLKIDSIINIDLDQLEQSNKTESVCTLNMSTVSNFVQGRKILKQKNVKHHAMSSYDEEKDEFSSLRVKVLRQNYKNGILKVKYYFVGADDSTSFEISERQTEDVWKNLQDNNMMLDNNNNDNSETGSENRNTIGEIKQIENLIDQEATPRILKFILQLVAFCFLIMISVSTANMVEFIKTEYNIQNNVEVTANSLRRMLRTSKSMNLMRSYLNLQTGVSNQTNYIQVLDIFNFQETDQLKALLKNKIIRVIDNLKYDQIQIDQSNYNFKNNELLIQRSQHPIIPVWSINQKGEAQYSNQTLNTAVNLFVQSGQALVSYDFGSKFQNLNLTFNTLEKQFIHSIERVKKDPLLFPPNIEILYEQVYSFFKTGYYSLDSLNRDISSQYKDQTLVDIKEAEKLSLIMMLLSVGSIFIITIAVIPNFLKIEERKYKVLHFFFVLHRDVVSFCLERTSRFEDQFYEQLENNQEESDELQGLQTLKTIAFKRTSGADIKVRNSGGLQLAGQSFNYQQNISPDEVMIEVDDPSQASQNSFMLEFSANGKQLPSRKKSLFNSNLFRSNKVSFLQNDTASVNNFKLMNKQSTKVLQAYGKQIKIQILDENQLSQSEASIGKDKAVSSGSSIKEQDESSSISNYQQYTRIKNSTPPRNADRNSLQYEEDYRKIKNKQKNLRKSKDQDSNSEHDRSIKESLENSEIMEKQEKLLEKSKRIHQSKKFRAGFSLVIIATLFSSYFLAIFFLSRTTYDTLLESILNMHTAYLRTSCLSYVFLTYREEILGNTTTAEMNILDRLDACMTHENNYQDIKRDQSQSIEQIKNLMATLSSKDICEIAFMNQEGPPVFTEQTCHNVYHNIFSKGLSKVYQNIYKDILIKTLEYQDTRPNQKTFKYLLSKLEDPEILLFSYASEFITDNVQRKERIDFLAHVIQYVQDMSQIHIIMFAVQTLIVFTTLTLFFSVVFKRMKRIMIDCNTLLKILPLEFLDSDTQDKIKHFIIN